ncbi:MAG: hypothetical protein AUK48_15335 [Oscillatoriales cyanobacterium CG2_30_44_21]|nr:MAG: hypothetical protein AUK48_15335 [Oscillatoriales cyanobacterium CG2_30_44_21]
MPEDKNDLQKRLAEIDRQSQDQELAKAYRLSQKNMVTTVILSLFFPVGGYIYTARWKAMCIMFSILVGVLTVSTINENDEEKIDRLTTFWGAIIAVAASIDNSIAIQNARGKIDEIK